ncbi:MAG: glycosyltransferase 87 family protein [Terriglobales bacterium]
MLKAKKYVPLLLAAGFALSMVLFVERFWAPPKNMHHVDLYARWYPARELLLHARDPYSPTVTAEIQDWIYGRPGEPQYRGSRPSDENRFAYPLYVVFLLAPTVTLSFAQVQVLFSWLLPVLVLGTVLLWIYALRWQCDRPLLATVVLLSFGNFPVIQSLYMQQPALLAAALLAGVFASINARRLGMAGALLALATIKPQLTFLLVPWLLLWSVSEWQVRKNLALGFGVMMAALLAGSEALLPGWMLEFFDGLIAYQRYTGNLSVLALLFGRAGGLILTMALLGALGVLAWRTRAAPPGSYKFQFTLGTVIVVTLVIAPTIYPTAQVILLPVIYWIAKDAKNIWAEGRWSRLMYTAVWFFIAWQWIAAAIFVSANGIAPSPWLDAHWMLVVEPIVLIPLSLTIFFGVRTRRLPTAGEVVEVGAAAVNSN